MEHILAKRRDPKIFAISQEIETPNYRALFNYVDGCMIYSEKIHIYSKNTYFDTYASDSFVAFADLPRNRVAIRNGSEFIKLEGPTLLFQPPYSLIETQVEAGPLRWECVGTSTNLFPDFQNPKLLTNFQFSKPQSPMDVLRLYDHLKGAKDLTQERRPSALAERLKKHIDQNFREDLKISHIADTLHCSRVVMSRAFKKTYGISAIEYRHRIRVHEALIKMRLGYSITDALFAVGFSEPGQFITHFKHLLNALPSQYRIG